MIGKFKFLFIEDNFIAQTVGRNVIQAADHYVDLAGSAKEALELLVNNQYDLIFLDCGLPDSTGVDLCKKLRQEQGLKIPIVAVTAFDSASKKQECLDNGFTYFLEKPFTKIKMLEVIDKFLIPSTMDIII